MNALCRIVVFRHTLGIRISSFGDYIFKMKDLAIKMGEYFKIRRKTGSEQSFAQPQLPDHRGEDDAGQRIDNFVANLQGVPKAISIVFCGPRSRVK